MLNADKPQVVQNDRRIGGNLCTDCCALIERIRSAAAPVRFYDQLNRTPAFKVNNAVSVLAEYQCAMNISRTVPVVGLCRIIAPNDAVCGQCGGFGQPCMCAVCNLRRDLLAAPAVIAASALWCCTRRPTARRGKSSKKKKSRG